MVFMSWVGVAGKTRGDAIAQDPGGERQYVIFGEDVLIRDLRKSGAKCLEDEVNGEDGRVRGEGVHRGGEKVVCCIGL